MVHAPDEDLPPLIDGVWWLSSIEQAPDQDIPTSLNIKTSKLVIFHQKPPCKPRPLGIEQHGSVPNPFHMQLLHSIDENSPSADELQLLNLASARAAIKRLQVEGT